MGTPSAEKVVFKIGQLSQIYELSYETSKEPYSDEGPRLRCQDPNPTNELTERLTESMT